MAKTAFNPTPIVRKSALNAECVTHSSKLAHDDYNDGNDDIEASLR